MPRVAAAAAALCVLAATAVVETIDSGRHDAESRAAVLGTVSNLGGRMQEVVNARTSLAHGLAAVVRANGGTIPPQQFALFAEHLRADLPDIRSLQLAPDAVVTLVHPVAGNERAIGHDIRNDPRRGAAVERAILERSYIVAGPFDLVQGGTGLVARLPIHLPSDEPMRERFWGFATVVLDMERLLRILRQDHLRIALRGRDGLGAAGEVFHGDPAVFTENPVTAEIALPAGHWQIAAVPVGGWPAWHHSSWMVWLGGLGMAVVTALLAHHLTATPQRLRHTVDRATAELEQARRKAEALSRQARQASEDKSRFLAAVSHDLQQPLTAMRLFLGLLAEENLSPRSQSFLAKMETTLQSGLDMLRSLMETTAVETGSIVPKPCAVAVRSMLRQVITPHQQEAEQKGLALSLGHCIRQDCRGLCHSDPILLKRVLGNLVGNAVRYSDDGRVRIRCHCRDDRTLVFVSDTGPGIPAEALPEMFVQFRRGSDDAKGVGLGLAIVGKLAAALGHRVRVRSRVGRGTVFMVVVSHLPAPAAASAGRSVLLVEDDPQQLFALQTVLEDAGFAVTPAVSAEEALRQLDGLDAPPHLLVADFWLHGAMTGGELATELSRRLGPIPTLILTSDQDRARREAPPHCRVVAKPAAPRAFREMVLQMAG